VALLDEFARELTLWQAATVVTEAIHSNRFNRFWLRDWRISNRCSPISTHHQWPL